MLAKVVKNTAKASLMVTAAFGIAWLVNKAMTDFFKNKAIEYDIDSKLPGLHPVTRLYYRHQAEDFAMVAKLAERAESSNPLAVAAQYGKDFYDRHFGGNGHRQY